jgi:hypothetical protein
VVYSRFVGRGDFQNIVEVWFSYLYNHWRTRLSSDFGDIALAGRASFALRISDVNKITKLKLCLLCIDSFMIFVFPLHMFFTQ